MSYMRTTLLAVFSSLFLLGLIVLWFLPETKGQPLPEDQPIV